MKKNIFFHGIGGIGMSALALYLKNKGYCIDGYDMRESDITKNLEKNEITVFYNYDNIKIQKYFLYVYSAAIKEDDLLYKKVKNNKTIMLKRSELLSQICKQGKQIAISGSHGKTTTTAMISNLFKNANLSPTSFIGGIDVEENSNFIIGNDLIFIAEADEYDRSFLKLNPIIATVNNIDYDHSDIYSSKDNIIEAFQEFINRIPLFGYLVINGDCANCKKLNTDNIINVLKVGLKKDNDIIAYEINDENYSQSFKVKYKDKEFGSFVINQPGIHNVYNSLYTIALGIINNVPVDIIKNSIYNFKGVKRRFELLWKDNDKIFVDDYAHHPSEIATTIEALKKFNKKIIVIFQPHLFSRTQEFYKQFGKVLSESDILLLMSIYPAREKPIKGITSALIADYVSKTTNIYMVDNYFEAEKIIKKITDGIFITLGAGDVTDILRTFVKNLKSERSSL